MAPEDTKKSASDLTDRSPESAVEALRLRLIEGQLSGMLSAGASISELRAALDAIEAQTAHTTPPLPAELPDQSLGLTQEQIGKFNAATFKALESVFLGPEHPAASADAPAASADAPAAPAPTPTPPSEATPPPESAESPLEADPFSREAILRINAIYHITPEAALEAFLADDEYITYHQKMAGGNNLPTGAIPIAQQLFCALPNIQQHQREVACIGICTGFHDLDTKWQAASCTKERDLLWSDKPAEEKIDFLKKGFLPETQPVFRQRFDNFQKVAILSRDNDRALLSYALLRLFRRGVLKDTFKREHFFMDGDALFARYADTDRDGRLNMVLYNEGKLMISINNDRRAENKYELFDLSPELTTLVLAECHAICLELLPTINYLYAREGQRTGERNAISTFITQSDLSGLRLNSSGEIESTAKNGEATVTSTGATQLGHQWYARGRSDLAESQAAARREHKKSLLVHKVFGTNETRVPASNEFYRPSCTHADVIALIEGTSLQGTPPALLPLLIQITYTLNGSGSLPEPLKDRMEWMALKTRIEKSDQYQDLTNKIFLAHNYKDIESRPASWPHSGLLGFKKPDRKLYAAEMSKRLKALKEAEEAFIEHVKYRMGIPYFVTTGYNSEDPSTLLSLGNRYDGFPKVEINADTDIQTLASDIIRATREKYEKTYADWKQGIRKLLAAYDKYAAELAEAESKGIDIPADAKQEALLSSKMEEHIRAQAA